MNEKWDINDWDMVKKKINIKSLLHTNNNLIIMGDILYKKISTLLYNNDLVDIKYSNDNYYKDIYDKIINDLLKFLKKDSFNNFDLKHNILEYRGILYLIMIKKFKENEYEINNLMTSLEKFITKFSNYSSTSLLNIDKKDIFSNSLLNELILKINNINFTKLIYTKYDIMFSILYDHQSELIDKINKNIKNGAFILYNFPRNSGKIFSIIFIAEQLKKINDNIELIYCCNFYKIRTYVSKILYNLYNISFNIYYLNNICEIKKITNSKSSDKIIINIASPYITKKLLLKNNKKYIVFHDEPASGSDTLLKTMYLYQNIDLMINPSFIYILSSSISLNKKKMMPFINIYKSIHKYGNIVEIYSKKNINNIKLYSKNITCNLNIKINKILYNITIENKYFNINKLFKEDSYKYISTTLIISNNPLNFIIKNYLSEIKKYFGNKNNFSTKFQINTYEHYMEYHKYDNNKIEFRKPLNIDIDDINIDNDLLILLLCGIGIIEKNIKNKKYIYLVNSLIEDGLLNFIISDISILYDINYNINRIIFDDNFNIKCSINTIIRLFDFVKDNKGEIIINNFIENKLMNHNKEDNTEINNMLNMLKIIKK